jgi:hypothetical protein
VDRVAQGGAVIPVSPRTLSRENSSFNGRYPGFLPGSPGIVGIGPPRSDRLPALVDACKMQRVSRVEFDERQTGGACTTTASRTLPTAQMPAGER